MAYGLRLINNNKPASLDGREWSTYGDPGFVYGKASHAVTAHGRAAREVLLGRVVAREARSERIGSAAASVSAAALPKAVVMRRWERHQALQSTTDALRPRAAQREARACPTFPVMKHHWHTEAMARSASTPSMDLMCEIPEGLSSSHLEPTLVEKYRYFSDPAIKYSINFRNEQLLDGLAGR